MTNEVSIRCQEHQTVTTRRIPAYTPPRNIPLQLSPTKGAKPWSCTAW